MDVADGIIGERIIQRVPALLSFWNFERDRRGSPVKDGLPLVHLSTDEAVEVVETLQARPTVKGPGDAGFPVGDVMVLADEGGAVTALPQNLGEHRRALRDLPAISRIAITLLGDDAGAGRMMVAPGEERGAAWRAERGRVETRV